MANPLKLLYNRFFPTGVQTQNNNISEQTFDPDLGHNISILAGIQNGAENFVRVDANGNLYINTVSSYFTQYESQQGSNTSATGQIELTLSQLYNEIDLIISGSAAQIAFQLPTGGFGSYITLSPGFYSFGFQSQSIYVLATTAGTATNVQLVGWK